MDYKYAAGMNSIICYDKNHMLLQRLETVPAEITQIHWKGKNILLCGQYVPVGCPENAAFFFRSGKDQYIPTVNRLEDKMTFQVSVPRKIGGERRLELFMEYLHTEIRLDCAISRTVRLGYFTKTVKEDKGTIIIRERKTFKAYAKGIYWRVRKWMAD